MSLVLNTKNLSIYFGGLKAVSNFNFEIHEGELLGLIGPNGAGKTTVFNMMTGIYNPTLGDIYFEDKNGRSHNINKLKPHQTTRLGIARTFQNIRLFKDISVIDNVKIAMHKDIKYSAVQGILRTPAFNREEERLETKALELLKIFDLVDKKDELAMNLPYGDQRRLEITRAMATNPRLLLLDEPAAGMNPQETHELMHLIRFVRDTFKLTILLIEHDMNLVMGICERITVLDYGETLALGTPDEIKANPDVIKAYLGDTGV